MPPSSSASCDDPRTGLGRQQPVCAEFVARPNRFLVLARLDDGTEVSAYLPNTGRLSHLLKPGRELILRRDGGPPRRTEYTVTRAWDGCWVALEANRAPHLLKEWLEEGNPFPGFGYVDEIRSEVSVAGHRLDLLLSAGDRRMWVEVKSGGRAVDGTALLSKTPSARGLSHLAALARLVGEGAPAAATFVVQRGDVDRLLVGGDADRGWIDAVLAAQEAGVDIVGFGCQVTNTDVRVSRVLPVTWSE